MGGGVVRCAPLLQYRVYVSRWLCLQLTEQEGRRLNAGVLYFPVALSNPTFADRYFIVRHSVVQAVSALLCYIFGFCF